MRNMKFLKNRTEFLNEEVEMNINSDENIIAKDNLEKMQYFNINKSKLDNLLKDKDVTNWESKASLIINGNTYMGIYWKLLKSKYKQQDLLNKISTVDEEDKIITQQELSHYKKKTIDLQNKLKEELSKVKK